MSGREQAYVDEAFRSNYVAPAGPMLSEFEKRFSAYTGFANAVAVSSGSAALHLALRSLHLKKGARVWASTLTFIGSVGAAIADGMVPSFLDCDAQTWTMDTALLAEALARAAREGHLPAVVIPTDLYGQACDLDAISALCASYDIPVVCDSAEAMGTTYRGRHAGKGAFAACYSFNGNKIITTSGGGMLASDNAEVCDYARYLSTQAREPVSHYEHTEVGFNYRLSNVCAAIGIGQLEVLDDRVRRKREIFSLYRKHLEGIEGIGFMPQAPYGESSHWLTVILIDPAVRRRTPEEVRLHLEKSDIEARPVWKPMHMQPVFRSCEAIGGRVAATIFERGLCLPSGTQMTDSDVERVSLLVREALGA